MNFVAIKTEEKTTGLCIATSDLLQSAD